MSARPDTDNLQALADSLWAERHEVEHLLYKLTSAKLLLATDELRFAVLASDEIERLARSVSQAGARRSTTFEIVARTWHMSAHDLTLRHLAANAPEPWMDLFADHHRALGDLERGIEAVAHAHRELAGKGLARVHRTMTALIREPGGGSDAFLPRLARRDDHDLAEDIMDLQLQELAYRSALRSTETLPLSLPDLLR